MISRDCEPLKKTTADGVIQTFGETFADGSVIDLVADENEDVLRLVFWDGAKVKIASRVEHDGKIFVPPEATGAVVKALQLPARVRPYGSTDQLLSDIRRFLKQHPGLGDESVSKLAHSSLATWFPEVAATVPSLSVVSADAHSSTLLLRLLRYTCRRSLHLGEIGLADIGALPLSFCPTLLLDQRQPTKQLYRLLRAIGRPGALLPQKGQLRDVSCPTVICTGEPLTDQWIVDNVMQVALAPPGGDCTMVDPQRLNNTGCKLQDQLLDYRLRNFAKVKESLFDAPRLTFPTRHVARTLGACVVDDPKTESRITSLLAEEDEESRVRNAATIPCVVIDAALFLCHEQKRHEQRRSAILVGELATLANAIFKGRDETVALEARAVGHVLRSIGLFTQRIGSAGRGLLLTNDMRRRIHDLAWRYNVLSVQHQTKDLCDHCKAARSQFRFAPGSNGGSPRREREEEALK